MCAISGFAEEATGLGAGIDMDGRTVKGHGFSPLGKSADNASAALQSAYTKGREICQGGNCEYPKGSFWAPW
jgi:hypothetical protein